jgi:pimeloyl-ACP methyl ester carboxylesterase
MDSSTHPAPRSGGFTAGRIVALVAIAALVAGLAYLRFAPGSDPVSVPEGAHAGQLVLHPCTYDTERGGYRADCGTLVVPENRHSPHSRLIALPVARIRARSAHPAQPIFRLQGGPGLSNMNFPNASRFADRHDVVLIGYRGVDGSSRLDCPEVDDALRHSGDLLGAASIRARAGALRACARRLHGDGVDLAGYTLPERVDDLDAGRAALGYRQVDLLSESAGTRTAMIYAWRHPASVHRSAMIAVNPPGHFLWSARDIDAQIHRYSALCARDDTCAERTDDLAATIRRTNAQLPDHWGFLPIAKGNARIATFFGLMESTPAAAPLTGPATLGSWLSAAHGDPSGLWLMSVASGLLFPGAQVWGDVAAVARADAAAGQRHFAAPPRPGSILGDPGTDFVWAGGLLRGAWPSTPDDNAYSRVRTSKVPTLLIGGTLDGATPARNATRELLPHLRNGRQVVLSELGHTTDFWHYEPRAGSRLINAFLDRGVVDTSLYTHRTVHFGGTPQTATAKRVFAIMVGVAAIMVLSLALMALRVRRQGRVGRRAAVALRSVLPVVLGLGGWFLGSLVVLTSAWAVPLDDALLVVLGAGAPIGLGIHLAWVDRDEPAARRTAGLCAAMAGALLGAWLGVHCAEGLAALPTTIAGAIAGANAILVALDIALPRTARRPATAPSPAGVAA